LRIPPRLLAEIQRWGGQFENLSQSGAIRALIARGLEASKHDKIAHDPAEAERRQLAARVMKNTPPPGHPLKAEVVAQRKAQVADQRARKRARLAERYDLSGLLRPAVSVVRLPRAFKPRLVPPADRTET
jgi:hypothetical protein